MSSTSFCRTRSSTSTMLHHIYPAGRRAAPRPHRRVLKKWLWSLLAAGTLVGAQFACATSARATALIPGQFLGQAASIETEALVGPLSVGLANASSESCPCRGTNGATVSDKVSSIVVGPAGSLLSSGVARTTAYGLKTATTASTLQTTNIANVNVLGGLITANSIRAAASVGVTTSALTPSFTGSGFTDLVIAGKKINVDVAENTVIPIAGLGSVTVKFVNTATYGTQSAGIEVEMLRITVDTANNLGLQPGTVIVVGEAFAGYNRAQPAASIGGFAETLGVTANAGSLLQEAAAGGALSGIGSCSGTGGATLTDTVASLSAPGLLSVGAATTTAFGGPSGKATVASTTSTVSQLSLLGGLITATNIVAAASESRENGVSTPSAAGSTFGDLTIAGVAVAANVAANTVISLPGVGSVVVNEQPPAVAGSVQVNGLHIIVNVANNLGLAVGTEIFVTHADASAKAF